jgi:predicted CXXCH cytochrome family protein
LLKVELHAPFEDGDCESCHDVTAEDSSHNSLQMSKKACVDCHSPHSV